MRLLFIILLFSLQASAATYYVKSAGGTGTGLDDANAWSYAKFNSVTLVPGDIVLFKKGDVFPGKFSVNASGASGNVITYSYYGTGAAPVITGFETLTGWVNEGGNIWSSVFANSVRYQNTVYINGDLRAKGRYPNSTFLTRTYSNANKMQVAGGSLTGTPNYVGGEVAVYVNAWTQEKFYITAQNVDTLTFERAALYPITGGFFIQNIVSVLDVANEWCIDTTTKKISVYATSQPTAKASFVDTLVKLNSKNYITFDGLAFEGANLAAFDLYSSDYITVNNCSISNSGTDAVHGATSVDYFTFTNNTVTNSWSNGVFLNYVTLFVLGENDHATISGNTFLNSGTKSGMGGYGYDAYYGIDVYGDKATIKNNSVKNTGYIGIRFQGDTTIVRENFVDSFCLVKHDGGGVNTWNVTGWSLSTGSKIVKNIITNATQAEAFGIYLDGNPTEVYIDIDSNTVYNVTTSLTNTNKHTNIRYNTFYQDKVAWVPINNQSNVNAYNTFIGNKLYSTTVDSYGGFNQVQGGNFTQPISYFGTIDSNYYSWPTTPNQIVRFNGVTYSFAGWQGQGYDLNGGTTPSGVTSAQALIKYNTTTSPVVYPLTGTYKDIKGVVYDNSITLQPYTSAILFKTIQDIIPPTPLGSLRISQKLRVQ